MNELAVVAKANEWRRMKALVLDSVSSPITRRVYNMALDEFFAWYAQEPRPGFTKATVSAWRVTLEERGLGSSSIIVRMSAIRKLAVEATDNGLLAPALAADIPAREERQVDWRMHGQLAVPEASPSHAEHAGHFDAEGAARPRYHRRAAGLRAASVGSGGTYDGARAAARRPVGNFGFGLEAQARPHRADANLG